MKFLKSTLAIILICVSLFVYGCDKKSFSSIILTRDNYNTGGNLTFSYDQQSQVAYFGGEGEVVQFYQEDIAKGWTKKGCRVGVSMTLPAELDDYKSATAKINGEELNSNDFIVEIDEQTNIAFFQPIVSEEKRVIEIEITWAKDSQSQEYKIIVKDGTLFMNEN